jgi:hypothetical protein
MIATRPDFGKTFVVPLEKGFYPFCIEHLHRKGGSDLVPA